MCRSACVVQRTLCDTEWLPFLVTNKTQIEGYNSTSVEVSATKKHHTFVLASPALSVRAGAISFAIRNASIKSTSWQPTPRRRNCKAGIDRFIHKRTIQSSSLVVLRHALTV